MKYILASSNKSVDGLALTVDESVVINQGEHLNIIGMERDHIVKTVTHNLDRNGFYMTTSLFLER